MKITEITKDCAAIELMKGDVSIQTDKVVCLVNPFDLVKKLEALEFGALFLRGEWIDLDQMKRDLEEQDRLDAVLFTADESSEAEALELLEPLEDVRPSTWLPTLLFLGLALASAAIGVMIGREVEG